MYSMIFRLLDATLSIHPPNPPEPPTPPSDWRGSMSSDEMLALYAELGEEMRALRSTEFSIVTIFYTVAGFLVAGAFAVLATDSLSPNVKIAVVSSTVLSLLTSYFPVYKRIAQDNHFYAHLLSRRRYIERHWFWDGMPGRPSMSAIENPQPGYRLTQRMLFGSVSVFSVSLAILLFVSIIYPKM